MGRWQIFVNFRQPSKGRPFRSGRLLDPRSSVYLAIIVKFSELLEDNCRGISGWSLAVEGSGATKGQKEQQGPSQVLELVTHTLSVLVVRFSYFRFSTSD